MSKVPKGWDSADVCWYAPKRKRPIAYSTTSARDIINAVAENGDTILDVYNKITYDTEAKKVLSAYIDKGFGTWIYQNNSFVKAV